MIQAQTPSSLSPPPVPHHVIFERLSIMSDFLFTTCFFCKNCYSFCVFLWLVKRKRKFWSQPLTFSTKIFAKFHFFLVLASTTMRQSVTAGTKKVMWAILRFFETVATIKHVFYRGTHGKFPKFSAVFFFLCSH